MFGRETFIVRVAEDAMAPRVRAGDYIWEERGGDRAAALLRREGVTMAEVESIAHGTTLVTNAVIERRGAKTGMLVTAGFRDILDMGFEQRYDLFDLRLTWPDPLVPRRLRREVPERVGHDGRVVTPLDPESTRAAVRDLVESAGIEALAICFLHSYANPVHEEAAGELARSEFPDLHVSRSAEVFGNMREYERWTTATMNAFTQPMFDRYVERLERGLRGARETAAGEGARRCRGRARQRRRRARDLRRRSPVGTSRVASAPAEIECDNDDRHVITFPEFG